MKFFIDTAEIEEIKLLSKLGLVDGVTTNPSLIKKSGRDFKEVVREIAEICDGPISAEVNLKDWSYRTPGFSGADLENLLKTNWKFINSWKLLYALIPKL